MLTGLAGVQIASWFLTVSAGFLPGKEGGHSPAPQPATGEGNPASPASAGSVGLLWEEEGGKTKFHFDPRAKPVGLSELLSCQE